MTITVFNYLIDKGLDCNLYSVLLLLKNNEELPKHNLKIQGWLLLLKKHNLITEDETLTESAHVLLSEIDNLGRKDSFNIDSWTVDLHKKIVAELIKLTGKSQVRSAIRNKTYSFLCNEKDFTKKMKSFLKVYKITDYIKIEKTILRYINTCHKENSWFPLLEYYILKDGSSKLATDLDSSEEDFEPVKEEVKKPIDSKSLF